jgi:hypothetical protein
MQRVGDVQSQLLPLIEIEDMLKSRKIKQIDYVIDRRCSVALQRAVQIGHRPRKNMDGSRWIANQIIWAYAKYQESYL